MIFVLAFLLHQKILMVDMIVAIRSTAEFSWYYHYVISPDKTDCLGKYKFQDAFDTVYSASIWSQVMPLIIVEIYFDHIDISSSWDSIPLAVVALDHQQECIFCNHILEESKY